MYFTSNACPENYLLEATAYYSENEFSFSAELSSDNMRVNSSMYGYVKEGNETESEYNITVHLQCTEGSRSTIIQVSSVPLTLTCRYT